ncbi:AAA family ATPase [Haliangium sp.]|uniref:AAA family ATPase n=1 Tax=Haliangium sp. TaxID=2663208 RepID=UPI003D124852
MLESVDHELRETIYESVRTVVYRGRRRQDGRTVVVKTHRFEHPPPATIARLRREYAIGSRFEAPGIIHYLAVEADGDGVAVVTEDFGGVDLRTLISSLQGDVDAFLGMAVQLTEGLAAVHDQNVIHKDIKTGNIVLNPVTRVVKLIDFGLASEIVRERQGPNGPARMEGSIAYMSPEQTGRMNRTIDYRTDLYSLGVTFYELLCGRRPFPGDDPLELIHCHIAKRPTPPHLLDPSIPEVVSGIIMKLLAKNAEERYQSARGLHADLVRCQQSMRESGHIPSFELGAADHAMSLQVSQRVYGRAAHKRLLLQAFERVGAGACELVLVGGPAGIGKSSLIAEMHAPITEKRGYFISGKCDPLGRNAPYAALVQAFEALMKEILTESESRLAQWRGSLMEALGPNAKLIIDVLPDLELIIGEQPAPARLNPGEAQQRFKDTFLRFVGVFGRKEHPLVLVVDDLQWADAATLRVLGQILTDSDCTHLLIVGVYRNDEVGDAHALTATIAEIRAGGGAVSDLDVGVLTVDDVSQLVADTLACDLQRARRLAELIHDKTLGNPYFIGELLRSLYDDGHLRLEDGGWRWGEDEIRARGVSTNVVSLLVDKVRLLSEATQEVLRLAACLGTSFSLRPLASVTEQSIEETARSLKEAIQSGLVQPVGQLYKQAELGMVEGAAARYRFTHDRVREAAYSLLPEAERPGMHWRLGKQLLDEAPAEERDARIFDIVNQLNQGMALAEAEAERAWLAGLDLQAGRRAAESMAHDPALVYLRSGIELVGEEGFTDDYELALALYTEACAAAQACDDLAAMELFAEVVLANATTLLDELPVCETKIYAYNAKRQLIESLELGLDVLALLGTRFPDEPTPADGAAAIANIREMLAGRTNEELAALPVMEDPVPRATMRIMVALMTPVYAVRPGLYPLLAEKSIKLTLAHGNAPESALGYANYGIMCCSDAIADYESAQRVGQLAWAIVDRLDAAHLRPNVVVTVDGAIQPWVVPFGTVVDRLSAGARDALSNGYLEWGSHGVHVYSAFAFLSGRNLKALEEEMAADLESMTRRGQFSSVPALNIWRQTIRTLLGYDGELTLRQRAGYDELVSLPVRTASQVQLGWVVYHLNVTYLAYLFRDYELALEHANENATKVRFAPGMCYPMLHFCYDALLHLAVIEEATPEDRERFEARITADLDQIRRVLERAPINYRHRYKLIEAEQHRVAGRVVEAIDAYDEAISLAESTGNHNDIALANERTAEFWLARNKVEIATVYARTARYEYARWGATAKVADLEDRYQGTAPYVAESAEATLSSESATSDSLGFRESRHLDMGSVFKATRVLSEEMDARKVVTSLMKIVIENAGAHRGYLLMDDGGQLTVQASGSITGDDVVVSRGEPDPASPAVGQMVSDAIVRYVVRTGKPVVLHDAVNSGMFTRDPHIRRTGVRSVLCMPFSAPMVSSHSAMGVLYLENSDTVNAFSHERVAVLKLITAQAAISLENARLYGESKQINATLEELVAERTKELQNAQRALMRTSRKVGQAEVAENLLHNAGNLLNSLTVSSGMLREVTGTPRAPVLGRLLERLRSPKHELAQVVAPNEQGARALKLLASMHEVLSAQETHLDEISASITRVVGEFVQMLHKHDEYLTEVTVVQEFQLGTLLDDAIAGAGIGLRPWLTLRKDYGRQPLMHNDQYGLERVVVTLLRYLGEVAATAEGDVTTMQVASCWRGREVEVTIGLGEQTRGRVASTQLFQQRSSSHPDMPTLHDCANLAAKLGGTLRGYVGDDTRDVHFILGLGVDAPNFAAPAEEWHH